MSLSEVYKRGVKLAVDNAPTLLSAVAVTGTVTTAYLTGKATFKAAELIADEAEKRMLHEIEANRVFPTKDKFKLVWSQYIPAAGAAVTTITCIVFANRINAQRLAALAAAYSISEKRFGEYKAKALEKLGVNKEQTMRDEMAQERVTANPPSASTIIMGGGDVLFLDPLSGRYFMSDMETVRKAINDLNYKMMVDMYVTLTEFYEAIDLSATKISDEIGWSVDNGPIDFHPSTTIADNGRPCVVIDFHTTPVPIRRSSFRD